jgi:hypothetical protein
MAQSLPQAVAQTSGILDLILTCGPDAGDAKRLLSRRMGEEVASFLRTEEADSAAQVAEPGIWAKAQ